MVLCKPKKSLNVDSKKLLVTINVLGSSGPIRFVVDEDVLVAGVIDTALKSYAREGRLPIMGSDIRDFSLYCSHMGTDALSHWDPIGSNGARNFILCMKPRAVKVADDATVEISPRKGNGRWKAWFNKSLSLKIIYP